MRGLAKRPRLGAAILLLIGLAVGYGIIAPMNITSRTTAAEIRRLPPREAFKSGSERAVEILEEMAASLKRIEKRLEAIEKSATSNQSKDRR